MLIDVPLAVEIHCPDAANAVLGRESLISFSAIATVNAVPLGTCSQSWFVYILGKTVMGFDARKSTSWVFRLDRRPPRPDRSYDDAHAQVYWHC